MLYCDWLCQKKKKERKLIRNEPFNLISNCWCWNAFGGGGESSVICVRGKDTKEACCYNVKMHIYMDVLITVSCHMIFLGNNTQKKKRHLINLVSVSHNNRIMFLLTSQCQCKVVYYSLITHSELCDVSVLLLYLSAHRDIIFLITAQKIS